MRKVGITGGIGSGKTLVCQIFKHLGIGVYDSDICAKKLMRTDPKLREEIIRIIGSDAYIGGELNRTLIAEVIFNNKDVLNEINKVVHAKVHIDFQKWATQHLNQPYVLQEAAILFESGSYKNLDKTILIESPEAIRIKRVLNRDNTSVEKVHDRIKNQLSTESIRHLADFIIVNDDIQLILPQILKIDKQLRS